MEDRRGALHEHRDIDLKGLHSGRDSGRTAGTLDTQRFATCDAEGVIDHEHVAAAAVTARGLRKVYRGGQETRPWGAYGSSWQARPVM